MSLESEFTTLLYSDVSSAAIDQLVTPFGLWARNTLLHAAMGFVGFFVRIHRPDTRQALVWAMMAYITLQIVQLGSPGEPAALVIDGLFDLLTVIAGYSAAWWVSMKEIQR